MQSGVPPMSQVSQERPLATGGFLAGRSAVQLPLVTVAAGLGTIGDSARIANCLQRLEGGLQHV